MDPSPNEVDPLPSLAGPDDSSAKPPTDHRRLWTPWRMRYVAGAVDQGCVFCQRLAAEDDTESLILHRGEHAFAIMNLYPYNTGHLMLVPVGHVASPEDAPPAALTEIALLLPPVLRALRRVLRCAGFNVGFNVGSIAGAGVADHLHQHVVPRWEGDANFMPILASTMVLPELIPVTYAKTRAELDRELRGVDEVSCVVLDGIDRVLIEPAGNGWHLPSAKARPDEPLWQAALRTVDRRVGNGAEVVGWSGAGRAGTGRPALAFRVNGRSISGAAPIGTRWMAADRATDGPDAGLVAAALRLVGPNRGEG